MARLNGLGIVLPVSRRVFRFESTAGQPPEMFFRSWSLRLVWVTVSFTLPPTSSISNVQGLANSGWSSWAGESQVVTSRRGGSLSRTRPTTSGALPAKPWVQREPTFQSETFWRSQ